MAAENRPTLSVLTLNLSHGSANAEKVAALVASWRPDVVVLTEITPSVDAEYPPIFETEYPYRITTSDLGSFALRIFSRNMLEDIVETKEHRIPIISAKVHNGDMRWRMIALHAPPPMLGISLRDQVLDKAATVAAGFDDAPVFLVGDLNVTPWSPSFARMIKIGGLSDSALGFPLATTWLFRPLLFGLALDHVLVSAEIDVAERRVSDHVGSDHRAVFVKLTSTAN